MPMPILKNINLILQSNRYDVIKKKKYLSIMQNQQNVLYGLEQLTDQQLIKMIRSFSMTFQDIRSFKIFIKILRKIITEQGKILYSETEEATLKERKVQIKGKQENYIQTFQKQDVKLEYERRLYSTIRRVQKNQKGKKDLYDKMKNMEMKDKELDICENRKDSFGYMIKGQSLQNRITLTDEELISQIKSYERIYSGQSKLSINLSMILAEEQRETTHRQRRRSLHWQGE